MANFHRSPNGVGYFKITWLELVEYSSNSAPICDECLDSLIGVPDVMLIAVLNQAYCPKCSGGVLARCVNYPEDQPIAERREQFYKRYFGIGGDD